MIVPVFAAALLSAPQQFSALPLDAAMQRAVSVSPDVAQARERVNEDAALLAAARAGAAPALTANYAAGPQAGNSDNTVIQQLATIGAQFTLGDYAASSALSRQAAFTLAGAQYDLLDAQRSERIKVSGQYFDALKAAATVELRRVDLQGAQQDLTAAQLRFRAGDAPRLDVVRAQVALASAQAGLDAANVDLENSEDALAVETGEPANVFASREAFSLTALAVQDPQRAVSRAFAQRADLFSAQQAVSAEEAAVTAAQRASLPAVTVSGGYTAGVDTGVPVHGPSANVTVAVPLSHASQARIDAERARLAQARYKAESIRRRISVDVAAAARSYRESVRAVGSASRARAAAQEELRATETGYRSGASSSLDVAEARRTYVQAALNEIDAIYAQAQAAATLQEEMGP